MISVSARRIAALYALVPMLALSACGSNTAPRSPSATAAPTRSIDAGPIDAAINRLDEGDEKGAQKLLKPLLKDHPNDPQANVLLESIKRDPVELLGARSFAYTAQPGDTMIALSQRFLGTRLKFYQLARYNHIARPAGLAAGTVLRIPGDAPRPAPAPRPEPAPAAPAKASSRPAAGTKANGSTGKPAKSPNADRTGAARLRGLGLAALNQGRVTDAVVLLGRASALDPANPVIARDLARAQRIAQAVAKRH